MGATFSVGYPLVYIVFEKLESAPLVINDSWKYKSQRKAEKALLDKIRQFGDGRTYGLYAKYK
jgi:hypothetical protein